MTDASSLLRRLHLDGLSSVERAGRSTVEDAVEVVGAEVDGAVEVDSPVEVDGAVEEEGEDTVAEC